VGRYYVGPPGTFWELADSTYSEWDVATLQKRWSITRSDVGQQLIGQLSAGILPRAVEAGPSGLWVLCCVSPAGLGLVNGAVGHWTDASDHPTRQWKVETDVSRATKYSPSEPFIMGTIDETGMWYWSGTQLHRIDSEPH